ncbi:FG-GAP repeat domain-containing protein [Streptomyces goshikiensis]|uniref:FG-GAP repeat domain-containing protein n=1 Tax=Streptomyces goshikiensis TaxID=1942 RepID=UPI0037152612
MKAAKGPEGCAAGDLEFEATALVKEAEAKNLATVTVGLFASDESDASAWKRFAPAGARLETAVARPAPPVISSAEFPDASNGVPAHTGKARTPGTFTFAVGGATTIEKIVYWSDFDARQLTAAPGASVSITPITPTTSGPHTIYAYAVDKAGYRSDQATYLIRALGNGLRDLWSLDADGRLRFSAGRGDGTFAAPLDGGATFAPGTRIAAGGDWGQDGYNDLLVLEYNDVMKAEQLRVVPNNGLGVARPVDSMELSVFCPVKDPDAGCVGDDETWTGDDHWSNAWDIADAGDFNGAGDPDLLVRQGAKLWAYPGSRTGYLDQGGSPVANGHLDPRSWGTGSRVKIGPGLARSAYPTLVSAGDFDRDGLADLAVAGADGTFRSFRGTATGLGATPVPVG